MKSTTGKRLKLLMEERNLKQIDILRMCDPYCQKYGVKLAKNDLSQYISDKVKPRQDKLSILGMALGVQEAWLMGYDVPMTAPKDDPDLTKEALELYQIFAELSPEKKAEFLDFLKFLKSKP